jgi:hypothetical protein
MHTIDLDLGIKLKGPIGVSEQQIMEAAILHFILELPPEKRPVPGAEIDVSKRIGGRLPHLPRNT